MSVMKLPFAKVPQANEPPLITETSSDLTISDVFSVRLNMKLADLRLYSGIFRQLDPARALKGRQPKTVSLSHAFINQMRSSYGLPELKRSRDLDHLAFHHARRMALRQTLFHFCKTATELMEYLDSPIAGENVLRGKSLCSIHDYMMFCCEQRQNVLSLQFEELGVGAMDDSNGTLYVVQLFRASDDEMARDAIVVGQSSGKSISMYFL
ncbi:hypothetical protein MPSEU_000380700 [Mayamaea pseudoterrestris]|nr:hypothetical protein MPSEU_000380700 [Mayamaea pseudoterrestris]